MRCLDATLVLPALLFACLAVPCSAADWQKTFTITGKPTLRVETNDASVHITGSDTHEVQVRVSATGYRIGDEVRVSERQTGNRVEIEVRVPRKMGIGVFSGGDRRGAAPRE